MALVFACLLGSLAPCRLQAQNITLAPVITTVAGNGTAGYTGNGQQATSAELNGPRGTAVDRAGNIYIADEFNNVVRKVDTTGIITTVVGGGTVCTGGADPLGDGCPATSAQLSDPIGLAMDRAGNLYIGDAGDNVIRAVNMQSSSITIAGVTIPAGDIATVAGNGTAGYSGNGQLATSAQLSEPLDVAMDSAGNLYIADYGNNVIRAVNMQSSSITIAGVTIPAGDIATVAGNGTTGYSGDGSSATGAALHWPSGVAVDSTGNIYIGDSNNNVVRRVNTSGIITTFAGNGYGAGQQGVGGYTGDNGPATSAELNAPWTVAVDSAGNLYIGDHGNYVVRKVNTLGIITTVAGTGSQGYAGDNGPAIWAEFYAPAEMALDSAGNLYIADTNNNRIRKVNTGPVNFGQVNVGANSTQDVFLSINNTGLTLSTVLASGDYSVSSNSCALSTPLSAGTICTLKVQFTPTMPGWRWSPLVVTDGSSNKYSFGLEGTGVGSAVAFTPGTITTLVDGNGTACSNSTALCGDGGAAASAQLNLPHGVALDGAGNIYIADWLNYRIRVVNMQTTPITVAGVTIPAGDIETVAGSGQAGACGSNGRALQAQFSEPLDLALDSAGNIYIVDAAMECLSKVDANGSLTLVAGKGDGTYGYTGDGGPAAQALLHSPYSVAVDGAGNIYIADAGNNAVRKVDYNGIITTVAGTGTACASGTNACGDGGLATSAQLNSPLGVAVDGAGNIYIADTEDYRIRKVTPGGVITGVAGNGNVGCGGDDVQATSVPLFNPAAVKVDSAGNIYIVDYNCMVIQKVDVNGIITTVAGNGTNGYSGDGGPATSAEIYAEGAAVDGAGNIYIADTYNNRVREVNVSSGALVFANLGIGLTSSAQSVAVSDVGNAALNFTGIAYAGSSFQTQTVANNCVVGTQVGFGQTCDLGAVFMPVAAGNLSGSITLTDKAFNGQQVATLSGTGMPPTTFSALTPSQSIPYGSTTSLSGTISAGSYYPPSGETVSITVGSLAPQSATIGASGSFSLLFTVSLPVGTYTITYSYPGDSNFTSASDTSTTLTVNASTTVLYTLNLTEVGTGTGTVTDNLEQISCSEANGTGQTGSCSGSYDAGSWVTLIASPTAPSTFAGWSGACAGTIGTMCTVAMTSSPISVIASFAQSLEYDYVVSSGTNVTETATICPNGSSPCTDPNESVVMVQFPVVTSSFPLSIKATEFLAIGLCPYPPPNTSQQVQDDPDCRFASFFNYGTDPNGNTIVPLCYPYANGNCVHYDVFSGSQGNEPPTTSYSGGVFWKIGLNNSSFSPASYWLNSLPRILDDPDADEFTPPGVLPYGTNCNDAMVVGTPPKQYTPTIYCQFDADITLFYNPSSGLDKTVGGKTQQANDVVVAFLPGSAPVPPPPTTAPTIAGSCVSGCVVNTTPVPPTITFTEGTGGTFQVSVTAGYPSPTLTEVGTLPAGLAFNTATGLISGTPADGADGKSYSITLTATNSAGSAVLTYNLTVNPAALTMTASSGVMTYGEAPPTITPTFVGLVNGDTTATLGANCSTTANSSSPVGTYTSSCSATDPTYTITPVSGTVTVSAAPVVVTASSATMTYGGPVPNITPSYAYPAGTVSSHAPTTPPMCSTTATVTSLPGTYPSTCVNAGDTDYTFTYVPGTVTVVGLEVSPLTVNFGTLYLNRVGAQLITLTNKGTTPITISSVKIAGGTAPGDYGDLTFCPPMILSLPATLPAGKSCPIGVGIAATAKVFSPTASTTTLTITDSAASQTVLLTAQVINPQASFSSTYLSSGKLTFPTTLKGNSSPVSITVTNPGNTPLTLGNPAISISSSSGDFALTSTTCNGATVYTAAEGGTTSCVINLTFTPKATGTFTGTSTIKDNAQNSPQTITLSGTT
ncbi:MAG: choice-of-anchor D domain-containing protein [Candidatus Sulfotelmatobacter sp.]|jgi:hypothetical protein